MNKSDLDAIQRVRDLHRPVTSIFDESLVCNECTSICEHETRERDVYYPCETIRAIEGYAQPITAYKLLCDECHKYGRVCFPCWIEQGGTND